MLHNRLNIAVETPQDIIDAILSFVTDVAWVTPWSEDPLYTVAGNPGKMVLTTSGGTPMFVHAQVDTGSADFLHFGIMSVNANWNTGAAPLPTEDNTTWSAVSGGFGLKAPGVGNDGVLHMIADNDRIICLLESYPGDEWSLMYVGMYQPLAAPADDPNPIIGVGNMIVDLIAASDLESKPAGDIQRFPNILLKTDPRSRRRQYVQLADGQWDGGILYQSPAKEHPVPKNDRAAAEQVFSFNQWVIIPEPGRGEALSLSSSTGTDGLTRTTDGLEPMTTLTIGANTHLVVPMAYQPGAQDRACMLVGPLGTAI